VIPVLVQAGLRAVAPDLVGFGRSDKPADRADYTYARHVEWLRSALFDRLGLRDVTLVAQDWGGLLGLRLVAEHRTGSRGSSWPTPGSPSGTTR
jgi:haloalkane dehalogenase